MCTFFNRLKFKYSTAQQQKKEFERGQITIMHIGWRATYNYNGVFNLFTAELCNTAHGPSTIAAARLQCPVVPKQ